MLAALLVSVLVALVAFLYGLGALAALARLAGRPRAAGDAAPASPPPLPVVAAAGLAALSAGSTVWALCGPLRAAALAAAIGGAAAIAAARPAWLREGLRREAAGLRAAGPVGWIALAAGVLFILARTAGPVENYDSGTYHAPVIRWLEETGYVPGLGNLHGRLSYSPGWFSPSALWSFAWLGGRSLHVLNGTLAMLVLHWAVTALAAWRRGERQASLVARLGLPLFTLWFCGKWLSSPTPDVAVSLLIWVAGALGLEMAEEAREAGPGPAADGRLPAVALIAAWAVAVKPSAAPLLLLPALLLAGRLAGRSRSHWREALAVAGGAGVVLAAPVAQAVVTTGYLAFPLPALPPLPVDWALPRAQAAEYVRIITSWARLPHRPPAEVLALPFDAWLPLWWEKIRWPFSGLLLAVALLAPLRALAALAAIAGLARTIARGGGDGGPGAGVHRLRRLPRFLPYLAVHATAWAGVAFWFSTVPDPRFGFGFVGLLALLLAAPWVAAALRRAPAPALAALLLAALLWEAWQVHGWEPDAFPEAARHPLLPADYPVPEVRTVEAGGLAVAEPVVNDQCWYEPFPCTPKADPRLAPRGPALRQGFHLR